MHRVERACGEQVHLPGERQVFEQRRRQASRRRHGSHESALLVVLGLLAEHHVRLGVLQHASFQVP